MSVCTRTKTEAVNRVQDESESNECKRPYYEMAKTLAAALQAREVLFALSAATFETQAWTCKHVEEKAFQRHNRNGYTDD